MVFEEPKMEILNFDRNDIVAYSSDLCIGDCGIEGCQVVCPRHCPGDGCVSYCEGQTIN